MTSTRAELLSAVAEPRRTLPALVVGLGPVLLAHTVVPHWSTQYGSYLVAFSVWMVWFVLVLVEVFGSPLEPPDGE